MYDKSSFNADEFISHSQILNSISEARNLSKSRECIDNIISKAKLKKGLTHKEALTLFFSQSKDSKDEIFSLAREIKQEFYGKRIVLFAPLYLSNYCVNSCLYCPYHIKNKNINRVKLTQKDIQEETLALIAMGHKRLALEAGEDDKNNPIEYIIDSINTIYSTSLKNGGDIRRVNVNIAATTQENYKKLKDAGIGTYILFQETYNKQEYTRLHPHGPKSDYAWHTQAMDRAMRAGVDDVGLGALFGLYDPIYELCGLIMHAEHLEAVFGVGPHTVSLPRIRKADDIDLSGFKYAVDDETFEKIIAIIRIALPYTGMIISTRESESFRKKALELGVSQLSAASKTSVGGYAKKCDNSEQFDIDDTRSLEDVVSWLIDLDSIPSFCTACYREGRTGDRFMSLCKDGKIHLCCHPNSLLTLAEYAEDFASPSLKNKAYNLISSELEKIENASIKSKACEYIDKIKKGQRDFRF